MNIIQIKFFLSPCHNGVRKCLRSSQKQKSSVTVSLHFLAPYCGRSKPCSELGLAIHLLPIFLRVPRG
ncbi:unnamed protein product [Citrullus colocynthis]|uniref:Uncharacterized protein n=1 Tax=Citrullus colocynthis TaxID=252529 RepID=A0ABP0YPV2_9ROSI